MTTATKDKPNTESLTIGVEGMMCASCVSRVERALKKVPGVDGAAVNLATEKATVSFDPLICEVGTLLDAIEHAGYEAQRETTVFDIATPRGAMNEERLHDALSAVAGVVAVDLNLNARRATVSYPTGAVDPRQLRKVAAEAGVQLDERREAGADHSAHMARESEQKQLMAKWIVAGVAGALLMIAGYDKVFWELRDTFDVQDILVSMFLIALPVQMWAGSQFYAATWKSLRHGTADMNTLIALGTTAAFVYSTIATFWPGPFVSAHLAHDHMLGDRPPVYFETSVIIIALIVFGRWMESRAKSSTSGAITRLMNLRPKTARVERDGREVDIPVDEVQPGDVITLRPGEKVPVDGVVLCGRSAVVESMLTG